MVATIALRHPRQPQMTSASSARARRATHPRRIPQLAHSPRVTVPRETARESRTRSRTAVGDAEGAVASVGATDAPAARRRARQARMASRWCRRHRFADVPMAVSRQPETTQPRRSGRGGGGLRSSIIRSPRVDIASRDRGHPASRS